MISGSFEISKKDILLQSPLFNKNDMHEKEQISYQNLGIMSQILAD